MEPYQLRQLYDGLIAILRQSELQQIADRVEAIVADGKITKKKIALILPEDDSDDEDSITRKTTKRQVYQREEFTEQERLVMLLDVVEATITDVVAVRNEVAETFSEQASKQNNSNIDAEVYIYNDIAQSKPIVINLQQTQADFEALQPLRIAINQIREAIQDDNS